MKMKELLSDANKWTQGKYACDEEGDSVSFRDKQATRFCLLGALYRCYGEEGRPPVETKLYQKVAQIQGVSIGAVVEWNDAPERTFQDVQELLEELDI